VPDEAIVELAEIHGGSMSPSTKKCLPRSATPSATKPIGSMPLPIFPFPLQKGVEWILKSISASGQC
jgi:hypothetical protein